MKIAYHASHEQFRPDHLLKLVKMAEAAGFSACLSSDHFHPWSEEQGQSGFAWSWLGSALEATSFPLGVTNSPGQRYHPAVVAQASATLSLMYPNRFWIAIGSGELLNEKITGNAWLTKDLRNKRLSECADVMRALWRGETVTHYGMINVVEAKIYSLPEKPPPLFGSALTLDTDRWMKEWADGLLTASTSVEQLMPIKEAFNSGNDKPIYVKLDISYDPNEEKARQGAWEQWRTAVVGSPLTADLDSPEHFEKAAQFIRPQDMEKLVAIITDIDQLKNLLNDFKKAGVALVSVHNVNTEQEQFIKVFAELIKKLGAAYFD